MSIKINITAMLAKIEGTYGMDSNPTGAANAIQLSGQPTLTPMEVQSEERDLIRSYFGNSENLLGSATGKFDFAVEAVGSGAAGTEPAWGVLHRGCGMSETKLAAALIGNAQVGGSTDSIKLAAAASAVDDQYTGMPITISAGLGINNTGIIVAYNGTTKIAKVASKTWVAPDVTSEYTIAANVVYRPVSSNEEALTCYFNLNGVLHKFVGTRGNLALDFSINKIPKFNYSYNGIWAPVIDAAMPATVLTNWQQPQLANKDNTPFFHLHGVNDLGLESLNFDLGNTIEFFDLINRSDSFILTDRKSKSNVSFEAGLMATKNWFDEARNGTSGYLALTHGTAAGRRISLSSAATSMGAPNYGSRVNVRMLQSELRHNPVNGNDEVAFCAH